MQGEKLIPSGYEKRLSSNHSITVKDNTWYDHATEEGGGAISFVQQFYDLSFADAVTKLLNGERGDIQPPAAIKKKEVEPPKEFVLPPASPDMRRLYAYLLKKRLISRDILQAFVEEGLIYESCEFSKEKEYHNAVFVGLDQNGSARHAHKRSLNSEGKSFRINVEGGDANCSFHFAGTDDCLYVFEAPIDLLSFISLHPKDWRKHSYVALCGTSRHAMLWMLQQNSNLKSVILCLDHDEAGIETIGRLTDILHEIGYDAVAPLRPKYKDWNEDLKAKHGLPAIPAIEHPQLIAANSVCRHIHDLSNDNTSGLTPQKVTGLFQRYQKYMRWRQYDKAMDCMALLAASSLLNAQRVYQKMGKDFSIRNMTAVLHQHILPHQNTGSLQRRTKDLAKELDEVVGLHARTVPTPAFQERLAGAWMEFALSCTKAVVKYEGDQLKEQRKEAAVQQAGPVMQ